jgi:hydrogenase-4 component B
MPLPTDSAPRYRIHIEDRLWLGIYLPIARGVQRLADAISVLQGGRLAIYLLYSFVTLLGLLALVL